MLSDLEADVLHAFEGVASCDGVWRLPPRGGAALRVAVVVRGTRDLPRLIGIPDARFVEWYERRTSLPAQAVPIVLGEADRARARQRADERAASATPVELPPTPPISAPHFVLQPLPARGSSALSQIGTIEATPAARRRVLLVGGEERLAARLRALLSEAIDITSVASGWEVLELTEPGFDVVLWSCSDSPDDAPTEVSFLVLLSRRRPELARVTFFVVDSARRARIERNHPRIAGRFLTDADADLRRVVDP